MKKRGRHDFKSKTEQNLISIGIGLVIGIVLIISIIGVIQLMSKNKSKIKPKTFSYEIDENDEVTILGLSDWGKDAALVVIPETIDGKRVESIADNAFSDNNNITSISLPNGLEKIGNRAFYNCSKLTEITLPDSLISVGSECFANCGVTTIRFPKNMVSIGINACLNIENVEYYSGFVTGAPWGAANATAVTE